MRINNVAIALFIAGIPFATFAGGVQKNKSEKSRSSKKNKPDLSLDTLKDFDSIKAYAALQSISWDDFKNANKKNVIFESKALQDEFNDGKIIDSKTELKPYIGHLTSLVSSVGYLNEEIAYFINDEISSPFQLVKYKGNKCMAMYIFNQNIYNTLKFPTAKTRATKMLMPALLPAIRAMGDEFYGTDIKYVSFFYIYGTKDFSDDGALATKAEVLNITAAVTNEIVLHCMTNRLKLAKIRFLPHHGS